MKRNIIHWQNFDPSRGRETPTGESLTVPEQTLSLRMLLERYVRGGEVATFTPVYLGEDDDLPDVSRMSEMEKLDMARAVKDDIAAFVKSRKEGPPPPSESKPPSSDSPEEEVVEDVNGF